MLLRKSRLRPEKPCFAIRRWAIYLLARFAVAIACTSSAAAMDAQLERGRYLVRLGGCNDCHTPGYFLGKPDMSQFLGGSEVGIEVPGMGTFVGPNLTPDKDTGLGNWTVEQIITAIQTGVRPDGRILGPPMPWRAFAALTNDDAADIAFYLKSLPAVQHQVPGPFATGERPTVLRFTILSPDLSSARP
jgi:mono/diheme cytochrome c family protein